MTKGSSKVGAALAAHWVLVVARNWVSLKKPLAEVKPLLSGLSNFLTQVRTYDKQSGEAALAGLAQWSDDLAPLPKYLNLVAPVVSREDAAKARFVDDDELAALLRVLEACVRELATMLDDVPSNDGVGRVADILEVLPWNLVNGDLDLIGQSLEGLAEEFPQFEDACLLWQGTAED